MASNIIPVTHVALQEREGGAAIASHRIHSALHKYENKFGIRSTLRVRYAQSNDPSIVGGPPRNVNPLWQRLQPRLCDYAKRGFTTTNQISHSIAWPSSGLGLELDHADSELLHLHWIGDHTLSIEEIGKISKPIVWTLHDQWPFCGAEHCEEQSANQVHRFEQGYTRANRAPNESGPDLCLQTWNRKKHHWRRPMTIVAPSQWMADCVRKSSLMHEWPTAVIPHPIDTDFWHPIGRHHARVALDIPIESQVIAFGAIGGTQVPHKGGDLLIEALNGLSVSELPDSLSNLRLLIFGQSGFDSPASCDFPIDYHGVLHDPLSLRLIYSAADVIVVPSRIEAFGQVALEAHACGTPVVAFATGGLLDIVVDGVTGYLATPGDSRHLKDLLLKLLQDPSQAEAMGQAARHRCESLWSEEIVAHQYAHLYRHVLNHSVSISGLANV